MILYIVKSIDKIFQPFKCDWERQRHPFNLIVPSRVNAGLFILNKKLKHLCFKPCNVISWYKRKIYILKKCFLMIYGSADFKTDFYK